jgi:hypothetical protein
MVDRLEADDVDLPALRHLALLLPGRVLTGLGP